MTTTITFAFKTETNRGVSYTESLPGKTGEYYNSEDGSAETLGGGKHWSRSFTRCAMVGKKVLSAEEAYQAGLLNKVERGNGSRQWTVYTWK